MGLFDGTALERPVLCDRCEADIKVCTCPPLDTPPSKQRLQMRIEKRRNGKVATVVTGFSCSESQIRLLFVEVKNQLGTGGTSDDTSLEVQGNHAARLKTTLEAKGYKVRVI